VEDVDEKDVAVVLAWVCSCGRVAVVGAMEAERRRVSLAR
jgi:hypothetical protein